MQNANYMLSAHEIAAELNCSKQKAYQIIRECNEELKRKGYITISGKIPRAFWDTKMYGHKKD